MTKDITKLTLGELLSSDSEIIKRHATGILKCFQAKQRLEYIRRAITEERVGYGELAELQGLIKYIDPSDVLLLEWAGVPEHKA